MRSEDLGATLAISGLTIEFPGVAQPHRVVDQVSLLVQPGEIVGIIGESGSGKTLTALSILGLLPRQARIREGVILLKERPLLQLSEKQRRGLLGDRLAYIPQDAMRSLNPTLRNGDQVGEPFVIHRGSAWAAARRLAVDYLTSVRLDDPQRRARDYPHQLSGGMQQRVMIAMGLTLGPELLIADEPTTALDVTVQAQVIRLLRYIRDSHGTSILFISHDLALVADFCDRVYVMYAGQFVEEGPVDKIFDAPRHPYTEALLAATPSALCKQERLGAIPGQLPRPGERIKGCVFAPRCSYALPVCSRGPPAFEQRSSHRARCLTPQGGP